MEGSVAVEVEAVAGGGAVFGAEVDAVGEQIAEFGVVGIGDDGPHHAGIMEDKGAGEGLGHLDIAGFAVGKGDDSS